MQRRVGRVLAHKQFAIWWRGLLNKLRPSVKNCGESSVWKEQWDDGQEPGQFYPVVCLLGKSCKWPLD